MYDAMKIEDIFKEIDERRIVLPDFQRDFVWTVEKQKRLLSSFLVSLPIGSLLLLEGRKDDFAAKRLCFPLESEEPEERCFYLLDGQQRISTLRSILSDFFSDLETWKNTFDNIYRSLRYRWFIKVQLHDDAEEDLFGWRDLKFDEKKLRCEPERIIDYIEIRSIFKTKTEKWFNPGFCPRYSSGEPQEGNRRILEIAKHSASENLIPLYTLYNPSRSSEQYILHDRVIKQIAHNRVEELKAEVNDGVADIVKLLECVEPGISELRDKGNEEEINNAWDSLKNDWIRNITKYLEELLEQEIPTIKLPSDEIVRATSIFEKMNSGGTPIDVYDLIVAKAARVRDHSASSLTNRIMDNLSKDLEDLDALHMDLIRPVPNTWNAKYMGVINDNQPQNRIKNQYLNLLSIFSHCEYGDVEAIKVEHIKKNMQLNLSCEQINNNTAITIDSLMRACAFLQFRCGIIHINNLPYELMILPIAYVLRDDLKWKDRSCISKIEYWYWCSLFGGAYRERQNERCIRDIKYLFNWLNGSENNFESLEESVLNDAGYSDITTLLLRDENHPVTSAISEAILQYVLSKQPTDFLPSQEVRLNAWDIAVQKSFEYGGEENFLEVEKHHIYPLGSAARIGESANQLRGDKDHILNSPLNKTYISKLANKLIRDKSPNNYLQYVLQSAQWGHCIPNEMISREVLPTTSEDHYKEVLEDRFEKLHQDIKEELARLKSM